MSVTLLITGFGPFPGAPSNPTAPLAQRLASRRRPAFATTRRISHVFPTAYTAIERELPALVARHRPDAMLMFGLAPRSRHVRIEMRACNGISAVFADAARYKPSALKLARNGPSTLPVRAPAARLLQAARGAGVPAAISRDAGRYLCNALFWRGLEAAARAGGPSVVAFVHVPRLRANLDLKILARAGEAILLAILTAARRPH